MNNASFDIELHVPKPDINWKNRFVGINEPFSHFGIDSMDWMK